MKLIINQFLTEEFGQAGDPSDRKKSLRRWGWTVLVVYLLGLLLAIMLKWLGPGALRDAIGSGDALNYAARFVAFWVECAAIILIVLGVLAALYTVTLKSIGTARDSHWMPSPAFPTLFKEEETAGSLTLWLLLGLEFAIAADIIKTAVSPEWNDIGKLAAIVGIRAFLGYLLQSDLEKVAASKQKELPAESEQQPITIKPAA